MFHTFLGRPLMCFIFFAVLAPFAFHSDKAILGQNPPAAKPGGRNTVPFAKPQYLIESLERSTTGGNVKLSGYGFYEKAPGADGWMVMPDGSGGTYNFKSRLVAGPLKSAKEVCDALETIPVEDRKRLRSGQGNVWADVWDCGATDEPAAPEKLSARLSCTSISLDPGRLPSVSCGIYVKGWKRNTIDRVELCFPDQQDMWATNLNSIVIFPGNESEDPANMSGYANGEYYFPLLWRARCQAKPGTTMITVHIQQRRFPGESAASPPANGECVPAPGRITLQIPVSVTTAMSANCTLPPAGSPGSGATFFTPATSPSGQTGQPPSPPGPGSTGKKPAPWKSNFGEVTINDDGGGKVSGTIGDGGTIKGTIKDKEIICTFIDKFGDGKISISLNPDGKGFTGDWIRTRGPGKGKSGPVYGQTNDPAGTPGGGTDGGNSPFPKDGQPGNNPGGPGTPALPPLKPVPASVQKMTLQTPEFRVYEGQQLSIPVWLLNGGDVANTNWTLQYDRNVVTVSPEDLNVVRRGNLLAGPFEFNPREAGLIRFGFAQTTGIGGTGTLAVTKFQVTGKVGSRTPLTLAVSTINNPKGDKLPIDLIHGFVEVVKPTDLVPGSNNGGPQVTVKDAQDALKMSVKLVPENRNLDLDKDGEVTSRDAVLIMQRAYLYYSKGQP